MTEITSPDPSKQSAAGAPQESRIVVGVDGSDGAIAALTWALREAQVRDTPVHVVTGWTPRPRWGYTGLGGVFPSGYSPTWYTQTGNNLAGGAGWTGGAARPSEDSGDAGAADPDGAAQADAVRAVLNAAIEHAMTQVPGADTVAISRDAVQGHAAKVLMDTVTPDDLLVVGTRGHGGFAGALIGSVSHHAVAQAPCPVVVVPSPGRED